MKIRIRNTFIVLILCLLLAGAAPFAQPQVQVIVQGTSMHAAVQAVQENGGRVSAKITIINAVVAEVSSNALVGLTRMPGVVRVTPNRTVKPAGQAVDVEFVKAIGAAEVWDTGNMGQGVTVAVLDSGVNTNFRELAQESNGSGSRILAYYDAIEDKLYKKNKLQKSPQDASGHGTHTAGIIGNSAFENQDNEYRGVAPEAKLVAVRVLNETGVGTYADVLRGIEWVVQNKDTYNIRVLNISMYAPVYAPYWADPYNLAAMAAWQAGIVVVVSAGNGGPDPMSIGVPGNTPYVITVGAYTDNYTVEDLGDDYIPPFSAAGPTLDAFVKPDVIAPGAHVVSLMHQKTYLGEAYPENRLNAKYFRMAGTSMSAAVVSGISALMLSEYPDLTPDQVKYRLLITARPQLSEVTGEMPYSIWQQGAGRAWAPEAVFTDLSGAANRGMDIAADLAGEQHYQGLTVYNAETGQFEIQGFESWAGGFESWAGGSTNWSGGFESWAGGFESWAGGFESWAGGFESWAGAFESWAGGFESWAGGYTAWAGGFESWAGGFESWAGGFESWAGGGGDPVWAESFVNLQNVPGDSSTIAINILASEE
ncbi:MAG: S8 family peptidase [Anaerolineae bacterium]|nr:S8 family peptidase [Anaerolineae bacterium]